MTGDLPDAWAAAFDAEETTRHEHRDCPTDAPVAQGWTGEDGRTVVIVTDQPACIAEEMELRGGCRRVRVSDDDRAALATRWPATLEELGW